VTGDRSRDVDEVHDRPAEDESLEVEVFSEETLTGVRRMTSLAYLTFVAVDRDSHRVPIPGLIPENDEDRRRAQEAEVRRTHRLAARKALEERLGQRV
jgi:acyl-CoA hydrolase